LLFKFSQNYYVKYLLIIFTIIGGYSYLIIQDGPPAGHHLNLCLFNLLTHLPCPGCGMGRATLALFHGNIPLSFSYNILCIPFTIAVFVSLAWALLDLTTHSEGFVKFISRDISMPYKVLLFAVIIIDWAVNIIRL